jgi:hypothetical protein
MESKGKINFRFNTRRGSASGTTWAIRGAPEGLSRQEVLFSGLKSPNTAPRGNLVVINISLFQFCIYFSSSYLLSPIACLVTLYFCIEKNKYVVHCILKLLSPMQINLWHKTHKSSCCGGIKINKDAFIILYKFLA